MIDADKNRSGANGVNKTINQRIRIGEAKCKTCSGKDKSIEHVISSAKETRRHRIWHLRNEMVLKIIEITLELIRIHIQFNSKEVGGFQVAQAGLGVLNEYDCVKDQNWKRATLKQEHQEKRN
ncbi:hypothetical protein ACH5RR_012781 [Cinchona calisaya]|uniref:Uncharacterized protein n=1 Tax=Cinchona calisaya TaxID=153742 RepID=A0ABD3A8K8_9GENT